MQINSVDSKTLKSWLDNNEAIIIDVRELSEYQTVRIKDTTLITLSELDIDSLPDIGKKKLVMQCKSGRRSHYACEFLLAQNPNLDIYNLDGGIEDWISCGYEVL